MICTDMDNSSYQKTKANCFATIPNFPYNIFYTRVNDG